MEVRLEQFELATRERRGGTPVVQCRAEVAVFLDGGQQIAAVNSAALKRAIAQVVKQVVLAAPARADETDGAKTKEG